MSSLLEEWKDKQFIGVKELADTVEVVLRRSRQSQEKQSVTEIPNERTIRYYISEGLISPAVVRRGQASVFGYEHLLSLLLIKKLQADGLPITVIRTLMSDRTTGELEELLREEIHLFTSQEALDEYRRETGHTDDNDIAILKMAIPPIEPEEEPKQNEAKRYLESLLMPKKAVEPDSEVLFSISSLPIEPLPVEPEAQEWERFEIEKGLEIHIEKGFRRVDDEDEKRGILDRIRKILSLTGRK